MPGDAVVVKKEMAVTHADFFRSLPNALDGEIFRVEGARVTVEGRAGTWTIDLGPEGKRRIALLALPKTPVTLTFHGYSDGQREEALARFERAFQRGGG